MYVEDVQFRAQMNDWVEVYRSLVQNKPRGMDVVDYSLSIGGIGSCRILVGDLSGDYPDNIFDSLIDGILVTCLWNGGGGLNKYSLSALGSQILLKAVFDPGVHYKNSQKSICGIYGFLPSPNWENIPNNPLLRPNEKHQDFSVVEFVSLSQAAIGMVKTTAQSRGLLT